MRCDWCVRVIERLGGALLGLTLAGAPAAAATTVVLNVPGTQVQDATVRGGTYENTNYAGGVLVTRASSVWSNVRRALLKFDTSSTIPAGSTIVSATLTLTVKGGNASTRHVAAHYVLQSFTTNQATWSIRKAGYEWLYAGGSLGGIYATATSTNTAGSKVSFNLTKLVQDAVAGRLSSRYTRVAIVDTDAPSIASYREYYPSETTTVSDRPRLTVAYDPPTATTTSSSTSSSTSTSTATSTSGTRIKVMDWNIHHGVGTDGVYNLDRIASWIAKINPTVVSLNEVERYTSWGNEDQPARFASLLRSKTGVTWYYKFAQRYDASTSHGQGNLVLSRLPIASTASYALSGDRAVALIRVWLGNRLVTVASTHLDDASSSLRDTQMGEVKRFLATFSEPRVVTGDFNAWPGAWEIGDMTSAYYDGWAVAKADGTAIWYSGNSAGNTRNSRIDYVWKSHGASALGIHSAQVFDVRNSSGVQPSDHRPVEVTFDVH